MNQEQQSIPETSPQDLQQQIERLQDQVRILVGSRLSSPPPPLPYPTLERASEPKLAQPPPFAGRIQDQRMVRTWLTTCHNFLSLQPRRYAGDRAKTGWMGSLMTGNAAVWFSSLVQTESPALDDIQVFLADFQAKFSDPFEKQSAQNRLDNLRQGMNPVGDYIANFQKDAVLTGYGLDALVHHFMAGLHPDILDAFSTVSYEDWKLDEIMTMALKIDNRRIKRRRGMNSGLARVASDHRGFPRATLHHSSNASTPSDAVPMEIGGMRITREERERRKAGNLCFYCGETSDHVATNCPRKSGNARDRE